jgi:hypothetical protein
LRIRRGGGPARGAGAVSVFFRGASASRRRSGRPAFPLAGGSRWRCRGTRALCYAAVFGFQCAENLALGRALVRGGSCVCSGSCVSRGGESDFSVRSLGLSGCCVARFLGALR